MNQGRNVSTEQEEPRLAIPSELPIRAHRERIEKLVNAHPVVIVCGETGSGKTTQLPKICLASGAARERLIGHTQPRRLAARSVAARLAEETGTRLGELVGYQVRFHRQVGRRSRIKLMTDGVLLAEIQTDPQLHRYGTLIIDEAHERTLNIDFLLGYLKRLLLTRSDLRIVVSSATIDTKRFSRFFDGAPVVEVSGRAHPVEVRYRPVGADDDTGEGLQGAVVDAVQTLCREAVGDVLVFLASEREIRDTAHRLRKLCLPNTEFLPLYGRLPLREQRRVFEPHPGRRVVLATNIAETSLTVPGIRYVVDSGLARISRYRHRHTVQRLPVEPISRASAEQRKGRCGRLGPGVCVRLYEREDLDQRPEFTEPEMLRANLAAVLLRVKAFGVDDLDDFAFMQAPDRRHVNDGDRLLGELGALDAEGTLTVVGRTLARMPVEPTVGRMLIAADELGCLAELLVITSALSVIDPREQLRGAQSVASSVHERFSDRRSDFMGLLKLWRAYRKDNRGRSVERCRAYCRRHHLSFTRMREWQDVHAQLRQIAREVGLRITPQPGTYGRIHRALLAGALRNVGTRCAERDYAGIRDLVFRISPASGQYARRPKWVMAAELVETRRLYAHRAAEIRPEWIERTAGSLLRRAHFEAHWDARRAESMVYEQTALHGLTLIPRRRVRFAPISRADARTLFIRAGLVEGHFESGAESLARNCRLIAALRDYDHRLRRPDVAVTDDAVFDFYARRLPSDVCDGATFERWRRRCERQAEEPLRMCERDVAHLLAVEEVETRFPDYLQVAEAHLRLRYRFRPGEADDGITVGIPVSLLSGLDPAAFEWLVPGRLEEKVLALLRALPKGIRRELVPLPAAASRFTTEVTSTTQSLRDALREYLRTTVGVSVSAQTWPAGRLERELPPYLLMRFLVVDETGRPVGSGRDLARLQRELRAEVGWTTAPVERLVQRGLTDWPREWSTESVKLEQQGAVLRKYPALVDRGDCVDLRLLDSPDAALEHGRSGVRRLLMLRAGRQLKRVRQTLNGLAQMQLAYVLVPPAPENLLADSASAGRHNGSIDLEDELLEAIAARAFLDRGAPIGTRGEFEAALARGLDRLPGATDTVCRLCSTILERYRDVLRLRHCDDRRLPAQTLADVDRQLRHLVFRGFVATTGWETLEHYPRYLRALVVRLDKLLRGGAGDRRKLAELTPLWARYATRLASHHARGRRDPELARYRWMLEEYRVSLFAQEIGAAGRISRERLDEQWCNVAS